MYKFNPNANQSLGRTKTDGRNDLKVTDMSKWLQATQYRKAWKKTVEYAKIVAEKLCYLIRKNIVIFLFPFSRLIRWKQAAQLDRYTLKLENILFKYLLPCYEFQYFRVRSKSSDRILKVVILQGNALWCKMRL